MLCRSKRDRSRIEEKTLREVPRKSSCSHISHSYLYCQAFSIISNLDLGMRTYDYILAMKEENQFLEVEPSEDSDFSSDESTDFSSPEKPPFISKVMCSEEGINQNSEKLSVRIDEQARASTMNKKQGFHASISPWKLKTMSQEKALAAANRAKERLMKQKTVIEHDHLKPLPLETRSGPSIKPEKSIGSNMGTGLTPLISSPRRRIACSPTIPPASMASPKYRYRSNFDLQLTKVSRELETYISGRF